MGYFPVPKGDFSVIVHKVDFKKNLIYNRLSINFNSEYFDQSIFLISDTSWKYMNIDP